MRNGDRGRARRGVATISVIALTVAVAIVSFLALQHSRGGGDVVADTAGSDIASSAPTAPDEPTSTPSTPPISTPSIAEERFLALGAFDVVWRGVAGSCVDGDAPVLERSIDGGETWTDVTPTYRGVTQLLRVDPFAQAHADIVVTLLDDASDEPGACEVRALRTFSEGTYWGDEPELSTRATYPAADRSQVFVGGPPTQAPCAEPHGLRSSDVETAVICDGTVEVWDGSDWRPLDGVNGAVALTFEGRTLLVAHAADDCDGTAVTSRSPEGTVATSVCAPGIEPATPAAFDTAGGQGMLWAGAAMTSFAVTSAG